MRTLLVLILLLVFPVATAHATIVLRVDVDDLTDQATVVVRGEVEKVLSTWTGDKSTIHTLVTLKVTKVLKGKADSRIVVTCPGGQVGDSKVKVAGVPEFVKGEKAVVFLWKNRFGDYLPLGLNQGRFRIRKDEKTGEERAENSLEGLAFVAPPDGKGGRRKVKRTRDSFRVTELEKKITDRVELLRKAEEEKKKAEEKAKKESGAKEKPSAGTGPEKPETEPKEPVTEPEKRQPEKKRPGEESPPDRDPAPADPR